MSPNKKKYVKSTNYVGGLINDYFFKKGEHQVGESEDVDLGGAKRRSFG